MSDSNDDAAGWGCGCLLLPFIIGLILYVCYVIICCSLLVVGVVLTFSGLLGLAWGIIKTSWNFGCSVKNNLLYRSGLVEDNAYVSFFHVRGDGFKNIGRICRDTFARNAADMAIRRERSGCAFVLLLFFRLFQGLSILVATIVYLPLLCTALMIGFSAMFIFYVVLSFEMRLLEWSIIKTYSLFNLCRHCHKRVGLPVYKCPSCGAEHSGLISSVKYGPFVRKCKCGAYLPASRFFGRNDLKAFCPHQGCGRPLLSQDSVPITIAVLGGGSVGKSHLMMDMLYLLQQQVLPSMGKICKVPDEEKNKVDRLIDMFKLGQPPSITQFTAIDAICLEIHSSVSPFPQRLYLYDPPGESFTSAKSLSGYRYYEHMMGTIFVIDPFTLAGVRRDYERLGLTPSTTIGALSPEESLNRWLISMEKDFPDVVKRAVCAVVVTKTDEASFRGITGLATGASYECCRGFLHKYDCDNLVRTLERNFSKVEFFSISAVGSGGNGRTFEPEGVDEVLKWLLQTV